MESNGMSPADVAAVVGNTDRNFAYGYPVMPFYGGYGNNNGFGNGDGGWLWLIIILALMGGWGNNGNGGFGGGFNNDYAWLSNGQKEIMQNTNDGFNTLQLANQLTGINSGAANAETSANARQMANMQQSFNNQIATLQGFNNIGTRLDDCCCENRLGIANLNSAILAENCADRAALADGLKDVLINQTANTQKILDTLCQDKIDAKNEKILDLQRQLDMADLKASQIAQNAFISQGFANEVDQLYNRLNNCPVPTTPVYGRTPIFTCNNNGCGCGCNGI